MILKWLEKSLIRKAGYFTRHEYYDQRRLLSAIEVQTIFDVGAHTGQITAKYGRFFPKSTIYSFEPFPESFHKLEKRFEGNSLVKPVQVGVSDITGKKPFYVNRCSVTNSLLPAVDDVGEWVDPNAMRTIGVIEVPVTTIDDFCKQESIDTIQVLKMDIQGGELMALEGAREKLNQGAISLIYTEMNFVPVYEGGALFHEICYFLSGYGYTLFDMYNLRYARNGQIRWCDAIFVSPRIGSQP